MDLCINCKVEPIFIKKRSLCHKCYFQMYSSNRIIKSKPIKPEAKEKFYKSRVSINKAQSQGEIDFIRNYFTHSDWIYEPCSFRVDGHRYTPDFYDGVRNVFIEVAGTRQAYSANREKYEVFQKLFPLIHFEVRIPTGELLSDKHKEMWKFQLDKQTCQKEESPNV